MSNNIEEDIKIAENLINVLNTGDCKFNERLNLGHCGYQEAITNIVNELKEANKQLDLDYIKDNYIHKDTIKQLIKDKEIYLPMANTTVDEYTEAEVICREIKSLKELLKE